LAVIAEAPKQLIKQGKLKQIIHSLELKVMGIKFNLRNIIMITLAVLGIE
jgi:hypothetical protein